MKYPYILVLVLLGSGWLYAQKVRPDEFENRLKEVEALIDRDVDAAFDTLEALSEYYDLHDLRQAALFKTWGEAWYTAGNLDSSHAFYTRAFELYDLNQKDSLAFETLFEMGIHNRRSGFYHQAIDRYITAREYAQKKGRPVLEADAINAMGVVHYYQGNTLHALEHYLEARQVYEELNLPLKLAKSYNNLGIIYKVYNNYPKAIEYYNKAIAIRKQLAQYHKLEPPYYNINNLYHFQKRPEMALKTSKEAFRLSQEHDLPGWQRSCHRMLANDYLTLGYLDSMKIHIDGYRQLSTDEYRYALADQLEGRYFVAKKEYEKGIQMLQETLGVLTVENDLPRHELTQIYLSEAWLATGQYSRALTHAKRAYNLASEEEYNPMIRLSLERLYQIHEARGDMANAYKYLMLYTRKQDSTYNETKAGIVGGLEAEQKLALREQENLVLQKDAELKAETIKRQHGMIVFSVIAALLLAGMILLAYRVQLHKRKLAEMALEISEGKAAKIAGELEYKNREIVNFAVQITEKNEFIDLLNDQIGTIRSALTESPEEVQRLAILVKDHLSISKQREEFNAHVENVYDAFFKRLEDRYPGLSQSEKRLAALLRLNLSSKEIASVVNISPKSVDMNRYRLRKKMGLENEANLVAVLQSI